MPGVVAFMDDLMFLSRIRVAAHALGLHVVAVRAVPDLLEACRAETGLVLVDLDSRLPVIEGITAVRADGALRGLPIVGFFSHVHAERGREATTAGCTQSLPRSAFVRQLDGLLRGLRPPN